MPGTFRNPILPGFYPDPSICRVGEDYYLVNSTFEYFPGLPIFHSRDLVHWRQLGHVLDRPSQLPLDGVYASGGLYAPTIRYDRGTFYVINTLVGGTSKKGNFIVTATNPAGPWSEPYWLENAPGIDPSLFFDDDGRAWYVGNRAGRQRPVCRAYRNLAPGVGFGQRCASSASHVCSGKGPPGMQPGPRRLTFTKSTDNTI